MSDEGRGAFGPFLLGIVIGAALGALFAPNAGEVTRKQVRRKLRGLRELAEEKADEISALVAGDSIDDDGAEPEEPAEETSAREELEQRLADARRRRRQAKRARDMEEEDHPVA